MSTSRVWFITGCSSGFGRAVAEAALARGDRVIGTLRKAAQCEEFERLAPGRAWAEQLDVRDASRIERVAQAAVARYGRIDIVFNNAGYGMLGAVEETSPEEARAIVETNFLGTFLVTRALLPQLRQQGGGHILNMSSGAGIGAVPGLGLYSATKFAVEGLSEALAQEVAAFGIRVTIIEPGAFNTGFPERRSRQGAATARRVRGADWSARCRHAALVRRARRRSATRSRGDPAHRRRAAAAVAHRAGTRCAGRRADEDRRAAKQRRCVGDAELVDCHSCLANYSPGPRQMTSCSRSVARRLASRPVRSARDRRADLPSRARCVRTPRRDNCCALCARIATPRPSGAVRSNASIMCVDGCSTSSGSRPEPRR